MLLNVFDLFTTLFYIDRIRRPGFCEAISQRARTMSFESNHDSLHSLFDKCNVLSQNLSVIENSLLELQSEGMSNIHLHYRDEIYLYIVFPTKNGKRKRKYIGIDPKKIKKYEGKAARYKLHKKLSLKKKYLLEGVEKTNTLLDKIIKQCGI